MSTAAQNSNNSGGWVCTVRLQANITQSRGRTSAIAHLALRLEFAQRPVRFHDVGHPAAGGQNLIGVMHRHERGPVRCAEQGAALFVARADSVVADAAFGVVLQVGPHAAFEGWLRFAQRHAQFPQTTTDHFQRQPRAVFACVIRGDRPRTMADHLAHGGELGFLRQRFVQVAETTGAQNDGRRHHARLTEWLATHRGSVSTPALSAASPCRPPPRRPVGEWNPVGEHATTPP